MSSSLSSTHLNSTITSNTTIISDSTNTYDYEGAAIYIAVILIWYSTGLALMLFLQVRPRTLHSQFVFDYKKTDKSTPSTTNPFANYHNIQADNLKKQILNELQDPDRRSRLWKIYYSSEENDPHPRYYQTITADNVTINHIKRKLADIHRIKTRSSDDDDLISSGLITSSNDNRFDATKFFPKRFTSRRPNDVLTYIQRPLFRVQSQPDTPTSASNNETERFIDEKPPTTNSRRRNSKFLNRFTVEKVLENNRNNSNIKQNTSK